MDVILGILLGVAAVLGMPIWQTLLGLAAAIIHPLDAWGGRLKPAEMHTFKMGLVTAGAFTLSFFLPQITGGWLVALYVVTLVGAVVGGANPGRWGWRIEDIMSGVHPLFTVMFLRVIVSMIASRLM